MKELKININNEDISELMKIFKTDNESEAIKKQCLKSYQNGIKLDPLKHIS